MNRRIKELNGNLDDSENSTVEDFTITITEDLKKIPVIGL